jgi:hypothetical protein
VTEQKPTAWVGDQVYDGNAGKEGIVTDVKGGAYILRPVRPHWGETWTAANAEKLTVTVPRLERIKREGEA